MPIGASKISNFGLPVDIPDSVVAQYDAQQLNLNDQDRITSWDDPINGYTLTDGPGLDYVSEGLNGHPSAFADGTDDTLGLDSWLVDLTQPITISGAVELLSTDGDQQQIHGWEDGSGSTALGHYIDGGSGDRFLFSGTTLDGGAVDTEVVIYVAVFDGANSIFLDNGTEYAGDAGSRDGTSGGAMRLGAAQNETRHTHAHIGEIAVHDTGLDATARDDEYQRLLSKWN